MHWSLAPQQGTTGKVEFVGPQGTPSVTVRFPGHLQVGILTETTSIKRVWWSDEERRKAREGEKRRRKSAEREEFPPSSAPYQIRCAD